MFLHGDGLQRDVVGGVGKEKQCHLYTRSRFLKLIPERERMYRSMACPNLPTHAL